MPTSPPLTPDSPSPAKPLKPTTPLAPATPRRRRLRRTLIIIGATLGVLLLVAGWVVVRAIGAVNTQKDGQKKVGFFQQLTHIVTASGDQLQGEAEDRVNILLMGYGGAGHDGPYLTDTMMVISYQPSTKRVAMLSIPRDLVVSIPGYEYRKINGVLTVGRDQKYPGGGEALVVKVVSDLLNIPIQYYARVDFQGFEDVINRVGGITVTVDKAFSDYSYPTENYGYQTIRFATGEQKMDGATALKFARSRHGNNGEGSDFARARRQQKILIGLKDKLLSAGTLLNPVKLTDVIQSMGSHSQTNMEIWEMLRLASLAKDVTSDHIINRNFDDGPKNLLQSATGSGGAYILIPRSGNYNNLKFFAGHIFDMGQAGTEAAPILVVNASRLPAVSTAISQGLTGFGLTVTGSQNASRTYGKTVIIDATAGADPATAAILSAYAHTTKVISPVAWVDAGGESSILRALEPSTNPAIASPKFIVILGTDQPAPAKSIFNTQPKTTTNTNANKNSNTNKSTTKNTNKNTSTTKVTNTNKGVVNSNVNTNTANTNVSTNTNS